MALKKQDGDNVLLQTGDALLLQDAGGGTTYEESVTEPIDLAETAQPTSQLNGSVSASLELLTTLTETVTALSVMSEAMGLEDGFGDVLIGYGAMAESITLGAGATAMNAIEVPLVMNVELSSASSSSVSGAVEADFSSAVEFADTLTVTAAMIQVLQEQVDLSDAATGGKLVQAAISESVELASVIARQAAIVATMTSNVDFATHDTIAMRAVENVTDPLELQNYASPIYGGYAATHESLHLAAGFQAIDAVVTRIVEILAESRGNAMICPAKNRDIRRNS